MKRLEGEWKYTRRLRAKLRLLTGESGGRSFNGMRTQNGRESKVLNIEDASITSRSVSERRDSDWRSRAIVQTRFGLWWEHRSKIFSNKRDKRNQDKREKRRDYRILSCWDTLMIQLYWWFEVKYRSPAFMCPHHIPSAFSFPRII